MANQSLTTRIKGAWNAFFNKDPTLYEKKNDWYNWGNYYNTSFRPDKQSLNPSSEKTIVAAIYNRIAMDVAAVDIVHARLDEDGRYIETINSELNNCLTVEANIDQTGRAFIQDVAMSMLDEGSVVIVPTDTTADPYKTSSYDILSMRTGKVTEWKPQYVRIDVYDENTGTRKEITLPKRFVSIIESPLYSVMNDPNSILQRLLRKLRLIDYVDEQTASSKLNMIIQLPYIIKTDSRRIQAEQRRKDIETQLTKSQYGIAYTDGTEKITQLSRPIENNLQSQIEYLTKMLYDQLGITDEILNGTASDAIMTNYYSRTIEPIVSAITDEMKRKFLTKTARTQGQSIEFFRDPFRLVPITQIADIADRFTRNEILSSNEVRQIIGRKPSSNPEADELRNKNLYPVDVDGDGVPDEEVPEDEVPDGSQEQIQNENFDATELSTFLESISDEINEADTDSITELDDLDSELDMLEEELNGDIKHYASPYYDPEKAHEYYMKTRKLKGRKSTSGLNEKGKEAASYIKQQINAERDVKINKSKAVRDANISVERGKRKQSLAEIAERTKGLLSELTARHKTARSIFSERKKKNSEELSSQQKKLIESHNNNMKTSISSIREQIKALSKEDKMGAKGNQLRLKIEKLREDNKAVKDSIRADTKSKKDRFGAKIQSQREEYKAKNTAKKDKVRARKKAESTQVRTKSKAVEKNEREKHKSNTAQYRKEADIKYINELSRLKSESAYLNPKRKKK